MADYLPVSAPIVTGPPQPLETPYSDMGGLETVRPSGLDATTDAFSTAMRFNPTTSLARVAGRTFGDQGRLLEAYEADEQYGITAYGKKELTFSEPVYESVAQSKYALKKQELASRRLQQASEGFLAGAGSIGAGLIASLLDPLNIAAGFIPVAGQARYASALAGAAGLAGRTAVRARYGALEGLVGAAVVEPIVYGVAKAEQADYTIHDSLLNIAFGGILGGGLHATFGAIGDRAGISGFARERRAIELEQAKVLDAAAKGQAWIDLPDSPAGERLAGLGESRGWTAWQRAIDDLPLEVKEATLRTAVADLTAHGEVRNAGAVLEAGIADDMAARATGPDAAAIRDKAPEIARDVAAVDAAFDKGRAALDARMDRGELPYKGARDMEAGPEYAALVDERAKGREAVAARYGQSYALDAPFVDALAGIDHGSRGLAPAARRRLYAERLAAWAERNAPTEPAPPRIDPDVAAVERMIEPEKAPAAKTEGAGPRAAEIEADPVYAEALETLKGMAAIGRLTEAQKTALADADARIKEADAEANAWNIAAACAAGGA